MGIYHYAASEDFNPVTAAIKRYVEQDLFKGYRNVLYDEYEYAIRLAGLATIGRDYYLDVRTGNLNLDQRTEAANMVKTVVMTGSECNTGVSSHEFARIIDTAISLGHIKKEIYQPIYHTIVRDGFTALSEQEHELLRQVGITNRPGGICAHCKAERIAKELFTAVVDNPNSENPRERHCITDPIFTESRYAAVGFNGARDCELNVFFALSILKRFFELLDEFQHDTNYQYSVPVQTVKEHKALDFWMDNVFGR